MTFQEFQADDRTYDAVLRNLQIIGEAVKNIPGTLSSRRGGKLDANDF
ncbi:HepT-like ribonuclease domain-containing protein [Baaleninema sp.]